MARNWRHAIQGGLSAVMLCLADSAAGAQAPRRSYLYRETWYEFFLKEFNPSGFDYGRWLEARRQAFLAATVNDPQFWYILVMTALSLVLMALCAKLLWDNRRRMRLAAEMLADVRNHDLHSRQAAKEAIERHNRHIEQCNRAEEASEGTEGRPGWGETRIDRLKVELQRVTGQLEATTQDRNKLQEELRQKSLIVSDLSLRLDALSKKVNDGGRDGASVSQTQTTGGNGSGVRLVDHINHLQEELYSERQKNSRSKGS